MNDPLERDLVALFHDRAYATPPQPIPPALLRVSPPPRRRIGVAAAVAAAALVVSVGVGTGLLSDSPGTPPAGQSNDSAAPGTPDTTDAARPEAPFMAYIRDGALRSGSVTTPTTADQLQEAGGTVVVTDVFFSQDDGESARSWILRGDDLVPLPFLDNAVVEMSPDGTRVVAVSHPDPTATRLTAYNLTQGAEYGSIDLAAPGSCCESATVNLLGFDSTGRVFYNLDDRSFVWDPLSGRSTAITGAPGDVIQVGPQGVLAVRGDYGLTDTRVLGEVEDSGAFVGDREFTMPERTEPATWSPSGDVVAYSGVAGPVVEPREGSGEPVRLDVGDLTFTTFAGFETEDTLLLLAREGAENHLLRCTTAGGCEVVAEMGGADAAGSWVFPTP